MKTIVVDTNIIFSALLGRGKKIRRFFSKKPGTIRLYSCKFVIVELFKHKERIQESTLLDEDNLLTLLYALLNQINIYDDSLISDESFLKAYELCKDVDPKDIPFVALAIELNAYLWTKDERLKKSLQKQGFNSFFEL